MPRSLLTDSKTDNLMTRGSIVRNGKDLRSTQDGGETRENLQERRGITIREKTVLPKYLKRRISYWMLLKMKRFKRSISRQI